MFKTSEISRTSEIAADPAVNSAIVHVPATFTTGKTFQINNVKLHVPVVTLSINEKIKFLEHLRLGLRRAVS